MNTSDAIPMKHEMKIPVGAVELEGTLTLPARARGLILFVHGSGSSRFSPRNVFVAQELQKQGMATLLIDLLTAQEDEVYESRFDIDLLAGRLEQIIFRLGEEVATKNLAVGLFGASTGAAAALKTAARLGERITAVVSRGGRPDLAGNELADVTSPTLLIVGGDYFGVIELNERALAMLSCEKKMEIIPGATHLFEEPGTLDAVARLAAAWFRRFFTRPGQEDASGAMSEGTEGTEDAVIPSKFQDSGEKPTQEPGKVRGVAKEGYRHFHKK